ncbi:Small Conductance Mechanosensitive Ion Channel (MscS) Family [Trachipleistophora hominis]|uniref:Small Conductance Mechanosensitive Ion Channel (MscS) Family n=1 Tax=Trachipleistophora hominis TaxID=72359 RepID=L7JWL6_TRAHO|nr:Small Conductance Mechanosensitive Ion Channel (MscS) Family [Trachipleistophora hominis]
MEMYLTILTLTLVALHTVSVFAFYISKIKTVSFCGVLIFGLVSPYVFSCMINELEIGIYFRVLSRIFKYYCIISIIVAINVIKPFEHYIMCFVILALVAIIDIYRAYMVEYAKDMYRARLDSGVMKNVLKFEKYVLFELGMLKQSELDTHHETVKTFWKRGQPVSLDPEMSFRRWSGKKRPGQIRREPLKDLNRDELADFLGFDRNEIGENIIDETSESGTEQLFYRTRNDNEFDIVSHQGIRMLKTITKVPTLSHLENFKTVKQLPNDELARIAKKYRFRTIFDEQQHSKKNYDPSLLGTITVQSLRKRFEVQHAIEIYRMISHGIHGDVVYDNFRWNIRQLNIERGHLHSSIDDYKHLKKVLTTFSALIILVIILSLSPLLLKMKIPYLRIPTPMLLFGFLAILKDPLTSFIFIIYSHPFDSGDRIVIRGDTHMVQKINLYNTTLQKWNGELISISNKWLANHITKNYRRSEAQKWEIFVIIASNTPVSKIDELKKKFKSLAKKHRDDYPSITCNVVGIENSNKMKLVVYVTHSANFQIGLYRWKRHTLFMQYLIEYLTELNITYLPMDTPVKVDGVSVNDELFMDMCGTN